MSPDPGGLPRWPVRAVVPIAFILLLLQGIANGLKALNVLKGGEVILEGEEKNG